MQQLFLARLSHRWYNRGLFPGAHHMAQLQPDSTQTCTLLERFVAGERQALDELLARYRQPLHDFVAVRLGTDLQARLDPSDVVQEAQLEVAQRMEDYLRRRPMPFHLWVRKTAYKRLLNAQRDHRRAARRSVAREACWPERSSVLVARPMLKSSSSPSEQLMAREFAERISRAVGELSQADRDILLMRHAEDLPYEEIACLLDVSPAAARKRYGRALIRLQRVLTTHGLLE
jgi:RNA polymerase sigma-70 factor (ECF subfamily)